MEHGLATPTPAQTRHRRGGAPLRRLIACLVAGSLMLAGCSTTIRPFPSTAPSTTPLSAAPRGQVVTASWYGSEFSGRRTSSGEAFDPNQLTAASRTLPIGSRVRVTNVSNRRTVVVRINDRGPYVGGRSLDLSHAAAQHIGLTHKGVGRVQVARVDGADAQPPPTEVSRVSYATPTWRRFRSRSSTSARQPRVGRRRHMARRRIVSNPIGHWLLSALPRF